MASLRSLNCQLADHMMPALAVAAPLVILVPALSSCSSPCLTLLYECICLSRFWLIWVAAAKLELNVVSCLLQTDLAQQSH